MTLSAADKNKQNIKIGERIMKALTTPAQAFEGKSSGVDRQLGF